MASKITGINFSILKNAEIEKVHEQFLERYKSSDLSTEEINVRVEVDKIIYTLNRCLAKLDLLVSYSLLTIYYIFSI